MSPVSLPAVRRALDTLDRWVLMRHAEAVAEARPATQLEKASALHTAAETRRDAALGHRGIPALVLARAAVALYLEAAVMALADDAPPGGASTEAPWELYDALVRRDLVDPVPAPLEAARRGSAAALSADDDFAEHGEPGTDAVLELATFLANAVDVRAPVRIRRERRLRQITLAVAGVLLVAELIAHRPRGPNLALHGGVVASSRRIGSGPPASLTRGTIEGATSFSTKDEPDPWVTLDLVTPHRVHEVTLVNGPDHEDESLPLRVETSVDGSTWVDAATRTTHFSEAESAVLSFSSRSARFVRIHGRGGGAIYLEEVEVR